MQRSLSVALTAAAAVLLLAGCTPTAPIIDATPVSASAATSTTPPAVTVSATPTSTPIATPSAVAAPSTGATGCATGTTTIPAGALTVRVTDVDGDGLRDTLFLTGSSPRLVGIRTAGGVFTTPDTLPERDRPHTAWLANTDGAPGHTIVVDDGTTAIVAAFRDCRLERIDDADGRPLTLPLGGSTAAATGVACNDQNGGILIEASRAVRRADGRYDIAWRTLDRVDAQDRADFSAPEARWTGLAASDPRVAQARTSHCWASSGTVAAPGA